MATQIFINNKLTNNDAYANLVKFRELWSIMWGAVPGDGYYKVNNEMPRYYTHEDIFIDALNVWMSEGCVKVKFCKDLTDEHNKAVDQMVKERREILMGIIESEEFRESVKHSIENGIQIC